jgi:uncharacterized protein YegL
MPSQPNPEEDRVLTLFPGDFGQAWQRACDRLSGAGYGGTVSDDYIRCSWEVARSAGPQAAVDLASVVSGTAIRAGIQAASLLCEGAASTARRWPDEVGRWLRLVEQMAIEAPESMPALLERTDLLLAELDPAGFETWLRTGLLFAGGNPVRRRKFFTLEQPEARHWLRTKAAGLSFSGMESRLRPYLTAIWGLRMPLREVPADAPEQLRRRPGFDGAVMRLPSIFRGFTASDAEKLYRAAVAHVGAHCRFTRTKFLPDGLKPVQVALVSLIEDARIEQLAMRELPGLRSLFLPFHAASPSGPLTAEAMLARLARALADPSYRDGDGWVAKGRDAFFAGESSWDDQQLSRRIGDLLGNDLGQMRVQFDPRNYVVQPAYRDDNLSLWDFADEAHQFMDAEQLLEAARIRQSDENPSPTAQPETDAQPDQPPGRLEITHRQSDSLTVARYPEFDYVAVCERPEWTTVKEYAPTPGAPDFLLRLLDERPDLAHRFTELIRAARVNRAERLRRQAEGEFLDLDACIDATISRRVGEIPSPHIHGRYERRSRDLSVLLLLDISQSTADRVRGGSNSVLDVECQAAALLAHAMSELGDPFAIAAFSSDGREDVRYVRIKDFSNPYDTSAQANLAGMRSSLSTRLGAAMRHAGSALAKQRSYRRLLLVVTDGQPSDVDVADERYLVEDARKATHELRRIGIDTFCVGLDTGAGDYLDRIFGKRNAVRIRSIERLPELLPNLYLMLTR